MMLILHLSLVAQMNVPLVKAQDATIPFDLFNYYEQFSGFVFDVIEAGLVKVVPKYFKPQKEVQPLTPLASVLQFGVRLFNSDLEQSELKTTNPMINQIKNLALPSFLRNSYAFHKDPVIIHYWPEMSDGVLAMLSVIEDFGKTNKVTSNLLKLMVWSPKTAAKILYFKFGIPRKLMEVILPMTREEDFWALTHAIKSWFERHSNRKEVFFIEAKQTTTELRDDKIIVLPTHPETARPPVISSTKLEPLKGKEDVISDPSRIVPTVSSLPSKDKTAHSKTSKVTNPDSFFSDTARKKRNDRTPNLEVSNEDWFKMTNP
jgi:hypothetical protein